MDVGIEPQVGAIGEEGLARHARAPLAARPAAERLRRAADATLAVLLLVLLAPVLLACAVAVRLDSPGPALFRQRRMGRDLRDFTVLKFRTMAAGAPPDRHREYVRALISGGAEHARGDGDELYKLTVDDRITRVGRFLRKTSLDELPQLWNVVRGEMSLVGPRPVIPYEVERYPAHWLERFAVRPGMTGLWQVSGRSQRTYEEMVELDIAYARGKSLRNDLLILAKTPAAVLLHRDAA